MTRLRPLLVCFVMLASAALAQTDPIPFISQLYPTSTYPGHAAFTMDISGANFTSGVVVNWNGSPRATTYLSSDHLQAAITAADVAHANTGNVTVVNPGSIASNVAYFPVGPSSSAVAFARHDIALPGQRGYSAVVGDFNNDGNLDVVVSSIAGLTTFLGNGNGTFQPPILNPAIGEALGMVSGDFDGDGNLDLILSFDYAMSIFVKGNGDGTFNQPFPCCIMSVQAVAVGDLNADGKLDFIAAGYSSTVADFQIFYGNGDGTFDLFYAGVLDSSSKVALGDFNHDGKLDYVFTEYPFGGQYEVVEAPGGPYPCLYGCYFISAGDINNDGKLDLVTDGLSIFLGNGDGTFTGDGGVKFPSVGVVLADLNNDNKLDAVVNSGSYPQPSFVSILLGNGDGSFQSPQSLNSGLLASAPVGVGDFNHDGRLDMVTTGGDLITGLPVVSVFLQTALNISPTFLNFGTVKVGSTSAPQTVTLMNIGNKNLYIGPIQVSGDTTNFKGTSNCGNLAAGLSCTITGTFTPSSQKTFSASVQVNYIGTVGSPQVIEVTGTGD